MTGPPKPPVPLPIILAGIAWLFVAAGAGVSVIIWGACIFLGIAGLLETLLTCVLPVLFCSAYLKAGLELVRGTATKVDSNLIPSYVLGGLLFLIGLALFFTLDLVPMLFGALGLFIGSAMIAGAILVHCNLNRLIHWQRETAPLPSVILIGDAPPPVPLDTAIRPGDPKETHVRKLDP